METVLITGATGQVGSYLVDTFLERGDIVIAAHRRSSTNTFERLQHNLDNPNLKLVEMDVTDATNVNNVLAEYLPSFIINCAAQSHVHTSFEQPSYTTDVCYGGVINLLEGIRRYTPESRFIQYSTSEMFGDNYSTEVKIGDIFKRGDLKVFDEKEIIEDINQACKNNGYQDEDTSFSPQSPYAVAKVSAHHLVALYRKAYNLHLSCIIQFNAESPRRGENFVTRKITKWIGEFKNWKKHFDNYVMPGENDIIYACNYNSQKTYEYPKLHLGNLSAERDWGYVPDYCEAVLLMLGNDISDDYVVCTGETHSIEDFLEEAFKCAGLDNWKDYVVMDKNMIRPAEVEYLCGRHNKITEKLGWKPTTDFKTLVKLMVDEDIEEAKKNKS